MGLIVFFCTSSLCKTPTPDRGSLFFKCAPNPLLRWSWPAFPSFSPTLVPLYGELRFLCSSLFILLNQAGFDQSPLFDFTVYYNITWLIFYLKPKVAHSSILGLYSGWPQGCTVLCKMESCPLPPSSRLISAFLFCHPTMIRSFKWKHLVDTLRHRVKQDRARA